MQTSASIKYLFNDFKKSMLVYYGIILLIMIMFSTSIVVFSSTTDASVGGMEMSSVIFLFVCGLNSFKNNFHFMLTNGVSRKTFYKSFLITVLLASTVMATFEQIYFAIASQFVNYRPMFQQLYYANTNFKGLDIADKFRFISSNILWSTSLYTMIAIIGYFITTLYYRINNLTKVIISVGVPVSIFVILPYIDFSYMKGKISASIINFLGYALGFTNGLHPFRAIISFIIAIIFSAIVSYILMRRATIKE